MLSKAQSKYIRSLSQQKYRTEHGVFIAEGAKIAGEWLEGDWQIQYIVGTEQWIAEHGAPIAKHSEARSHTVSEDELAALSLLHAPNEALLVVRLPANNQPPSTEITSIALDNLQDPGNMGTIIRIADWFGIDQVVCSPGCADAFNPKVIQSAMGGHLRVSVHKTDLAAYLGNTSLPVYAATLVGESVYSVKKTGPFILVIGNESKGVSDEIVAMATGKVTIPRFGGAESLNAGVATGILCALLVPESTH